MEDRLENRAASIGDISILPVIRNAVGRAVPMPETQCASNYRHGELLIEGAIPRRLKPAAAKALGRVAREGGESSAVHIGVRHHRPLVIAVNCPVGEVPGLKSAVLDYSSIARCRTRSCTWSYGWRRRGRRSWRDSCSWVWCRGRSGPDSSENGATITHSRGTGGGNSRKGKVCWGALTRPGFSSVRCP